MAEITLDEAEAIISEAQSKQKNITFDVFYGDKEEDVDQKRIEVETLKSALETTDKMERRTFDDEDDYFQNPLGIEVSVNDARAFYAELQRYGWPTVQK